MIPYTEALKIAESIKANLKPHCERIEIAGSIRRRKEEVKDIEIVCIPRLYSRPNKKGYKVPVMGFIEAVNSYGLGEGEPHLNKYMRRYTSEGYAIDLFTCRPENWGYIFAIRTGSADYSHHVLASGWVRKGYKGKDGYLTKNGAVVPVYEESELFERIGLPYALPENRNL